MILEDFISQNANLLVGIAIGLFSALLIELIRDMANLASWNRSIYFEQVKQQTPEENETKEEVDTSVDIGKRKEERRQAPAI